MKRSFPIERVMIDISFTLLCLFVSLFAIDVLLEKAQKATPAAEQITGPEKHIMVEMEWSPGSDCDIDLWVKGPRDLLPVGYSRTNDAQSSYLRDDKGKTGDLSSFNYETVSIRALSAGVYIINVHWFGDRSENGTVEVMVRASISKSGGASFRVAEQKLLMTFKGEETTAFTFEIDDKGDVVAGSFSRNFIPLRNQKEDAQ